VWEFVVEQWLSVRRILMNKRHLLLSTRRTSSHCSTTQHELLFLTIIRLDTIIGENYTIYRVILNDFRGFNNTPRRSPDATPCDFFLWGYVKDQVYVPPLPASILELKARIRTAIETITADMRNELDYRFDICKITKGAYREHQKGM